MSQKDEPADGNLLITLANVNASMIHLAETLRANSNVSEVMRSCDIRTYTNSTVFEAYVEAETKAGTAYCWWVDISYSPKSWTVDRSILKTTGAGQEKIKEFPPQVFRTAEELWSKAGPLLEEFVSSALHFDFDPNH